MKSVQMELTTTVQHDICWMVCIGQFQDQLPVLRWHANDGLPRQSWIL